MPRVVARPTVSSRVVAWQQHRSWGCHTSSRCRRRRVPLPRKRTTGDPVPHRLSRNANPARQLRHRHSQLLHSDLDLLSNFHMAPSLVVGVARLPQQVFVGKTTERDIECCCCFFAAVQIQPPCRLSAYVFSALSNLRRSTTPWGIKSLFVRRR